MKNERLCASGTGCGKKKLEEKNEEKDGELVIQMTFPYLFGTTKING